MPVQDHVPEYPLRHAVAAPPSPTVLWTYPSLVEFSPYTRQTNAGDPQKYRPARECFLDPQNTTGPPSIYAYPGIPQYQPAPLTGSLQVLGIRDDVCFERFGRFGPYGYGYGINSGGTGEGLDVEDWGSQDVWAMMGPRIDWRTVNWSEAQQRCLRRNQERFRQTAAAQDNSPPSNTSGAVQLVPRSAVVLRTWTGFEYTPHVVMNLRALINELSLGSGAEYDVHLLVHVKGGTAPFWKSKRLYDRIVSESVPAEFRDLVTLWSETQMKMVYPGPFYNDTSRLHLPVWDVTRSMHMPLQYFAMKHPEYDFFWNWEMDIRYTGHYYELFRQLGQWARDQPRKGLWERNAKYYIPAIHGDWKHFSQKVQKENMHGGNRPVWGPVNFPSSEPVLEQYVVRPPNNSTDNSQDSWGIDEDADLILLNPIFDPQDSHWYFEKDVTGYDRSLPLPPRRAAINTAGRLSQRLLRAMHDEMQRLHHTMWTEMWPATAALHYGLKAVYAPHPVYFDRRWPLDRFEAAFDGGRFGSAGGNASSPFGWREHQHRGSSWYFDSRFAGTLWRRWLGVRERGVGGREDEETGSGRMCLRPVLLHPIKHETGPTG